MLLKTNLDISETFQFLKDNFSSGIEHFITIDGEKHLFKTDGIVSHDKLLQLSYDVLSATKSMTSFRPADLFFDAIYHRFPGALKLGEHQDMNWFGWSRFVNNCQSYFFLLDPGHVNIHIAMNSHLTTYDPLLQKSNCIKLSYQPIQLNFGEVLIMDSNTAFSIPEHRHSDAVRLAQLVYSKDLIPGTREKYLRSLQELRNSMILTKIMRMNNQKSLATA